VRYASRIETNSSIYQDTVMNPSKHDLFILLYIKISTKIEIWFQEKQYYCVYYVVYLYSKSCVVSRSPVVAARWVLCYLFSYLHNRHIKHDENGRPLIAQ